MDLIPVCLALASGALFGLSVHINRLGLAGINGQTGALVSVTTTAVLFWLGAVAVVEAGWWLSRGTLIFAACGLLVPAFGQRLQIAAVERVGPALSAAIGSFVPLFAIFPAVLFLGETLTVQMSVGVTLLILGLVLGAVGPKRATRGWPLVALLLPIGAAVARGVVQPLAKYGMADVPSPYFSMMIMATVSTLVLWVMRRFAGPIRMSTAQRGAAGWFVLAGLLNGLGLLALLAAIARGDITAVAPLASTSPLWAVLIGATVLRSEHLGLRHLLVAVLVVAGAALIVAH